MVIYKIYAYDKQVGDYVIVSPSAVNQDKYEMIKIAKRMAHEMSEFYSDVKLKVIEYKLINDSFIDVE